MLPLKGQGADGKTQKTGDLIHHPQMMGPSYQFGQGKEKRGNPRRPHAGMPPWRESGSW
jgi:hypothetical protein